LDKSQHWRGYEAGHRGDSNYYHYASQLVTTNQGFTNDADSLKSAVNGIDAWGGTNTQAGIHLAQQLLDQVTADYEFIIV